VVSHVNQCKTFGIAVIVGITVIVKGNMGSQDRLGNMRDEVRGGTANILLELSKCSVVSLNERSMSRTSTDVII
jgi:hypothetical protein